MKDCKQCGSSFNPVRPLQAVCSPICASRLVKAAKKEEAERTKARKAAIKRIPELKAEAQTAFNAFIRARDRHLGCFVCGKAFPVGQLGGDFDAGHVRSRGAASHLAFNEDNCHGECKECNSSWGAKPHQLKEGAIRRIGLERYEALEANNTPHKWQRDELIEIKETYKRKLKELQHEQ
jgi:5-methylcytosine-specific restriction endonuclease McrA